jgi:hypothetical protein
MKLTAVAALVAALAMLAGTTNAKASSGINASVGNIATVMIGFVATNFDFTVYNCPAGEEMAVDFWEAEQPARGPGLGVVGSQPFGPSTGEQVQYLTLTAGGNFLSGESWVGDGFVSCGAVVVPVSGTGQTKAQNGL